MIIAEQRKFGLSNLEPQSPYKEEFSFLQLLILIDDFQHRSYRSSSLDSMIVYVSLFVCGWLPVSISDV